MQTQTQKVTARRQTYPRFSCDSLGHRGQVFKIATTMPTAADIQKAAERVYNGTDVIGTIIKMKKETRNAIINGATAVLNAA